MALDKPAYKGKILQIMQDMREREEISDEEFAERWATATEEFVKTAAINYVNGLVAPNGPVTGTFAGTLQ